MVFSIGISRADDKDPNKSAELNEIDTKRADMVEVVGSEESRRKRSRRIERGGDEDKQKRNECEEKREQDGSHHKESSHWKVAEIRDRSTEAETIDTKIFAGRDAWR